jgi:hypothetical protein
MGILNKLSLLITASRLSDHLPATWLFGTMSYVQRSACYAYRRMDNELGSSSLAALKRVRSFQEQKEGDQEPISEPC